MQDGHVAVCEPLSMALFPGFSEDYCNCCFRHQPSQLKKCAKCKFVRYCSRSCQKNDWTEMHQQECDYLKGKYETWLKLNSGEIEDACCSAELSLLVLRLLIKFQAGELDSIRGRISKKSLMDWDDSTSVLVRMDKLNQIEAAGRFVVQFYLPDADRSTSNAATMIMRRIFLHLHTIFVGCLSGVQAIGVAFDLDLPAFKHCCGPNADLLWHDGKVYVIPLDPKLNAHDISITALSRVHVLEPTCVRKRLLESFGVYSCACKRCSRPDEALDAAVQCFSCSMPVPVLIKPNFAKPSKQFICLSCKQTQPAQTITDAVKLMKETQEHFLAKLHPLSADTSSLLRSSQESSLLYEALLERSRGLLSIEFNLFYCQLLLCSISPQQDREVLLYKCRSYFRTLLYWVPSAACTPNTDNVRSLIIFAYLLISKQNFDEAAIVLQRLVAGARNYFIVGSVPYQIFIDDLTAYIDKRDKTSDDLVELLQNAAISRTQRKGVNGSISK